MHRSPPPFPSLSLSLSLSLQQGGHGSRQGESLRRGVSEEELSVLETLIRTHHHEPDQPAGTCTSLITQRIDAPLGAVWSIVRRFDQPERHKHLIKSCAVTQDDGGVDSVRELAVISGLPASTSIDRLEMLDERGTSSAFGSSAVSTTSRTTGPSPPPPSSPAGLESYVVDIPKGNTKEDMRMFIDTIVKLKLQNLHCHCRSHFLQLKMKGTRGHIQR
ncbi:unnamed protein product [Spirodela intermedia]|uniref:Uncharacterized protein n=1 Tax=Spirodela intermedia TaxID=51605 RepID=A0A7I8JRS2_SPIIN|nr:unnamed protein product [Spirodela intermedia]CAA6672829.1 unnamed protein product [Spirodela intermedia]